MSHCYVTLPFHKLFHIYHHTHIYHPIIYIHIYIWYHIYMHHITSWIMQLWSPTICCHHLLSTSWKIKSQWYNPVWVQRPKKQRNQRFKSESKGQRMWHWWYKSWSESEGSRTSSASVQGHEKTDVSGQAESELTLSLHFCFIQALWGLDGAHLHRWRQSALLRLPS